MITIITVIIVALWPIIAQYIGGIILTIFQFATDIVHGVCMFLVEALTKQFIVSADMLNGEDKIMTSIINDFGSPFKTLARSVLILVVAWHIFKGFFSFLGLGTEEEEAWKIGLKFMLYGFLIYESRTICYLILDFFGSLVSDLNLTTFNVTWLNEYGENFKTFLNDSVKGENFLDTVKNAYIDSFPQTINMVVTIIMFGFLLATDVKLLGIAVDLGEKYVRTAFLVIIAPISIACGVTKATSQIFNAWVKSFTGLLVAIFIKYFLIKVFSESMQKILYVYDGGNMIKGAVIIIVFVSLIEQADDLVKQLGFQAGRMMEAPSETLASMLKSSRKWG